MSALKSTAYAQLDAARSLRRSGDVAGAWEKLAQAHILSQPLLACHLKVHAAMLSLALATRNSKEVAGQTLRILLAPLGHLTGRIPWGNSGLSTVSPFLPAPISNDVRQLYLDANVKVADDA